MRKLLTTILLLCLGTSLIAKEIDITKSKGTNQERIVSLHPKPAHMEVAQDITFKVIFDVELDAKHVKKNDIKLKSLSDKKKKKIKGEVAYLSDEKAVTFKPEQDLEVGYYEIEIKSLKPTKENKKKKIKEIKYRFYVPEMLNGYMLPIEPDAKVNNSTLLGIDSNGNGVRDDVERYIVKTYKDHHEIVTEIGFQMARAYNKAIEMGLLADRNDRYILDAMDCNMYFEEIAEHFGDPILIDHIIDFKNLQLNTKSRVVAYLEYDKQFSGGVYRLTPYSQQKSKCTFDIDTLWGGK